MWYVVCAYVHLDSLDQGLQFSQAPWEECKSQIQCSSPTLQLRGQAQRAGAFLWVAQSGSRRILSDDSYKEQAFLNQEMVQRSSYRRWLLSITTLYSAPQAGLTHHRLANSSKAEP